jgi:hypothetical protein
LLAFLAAFDLSTVISGPHTRRCWAAWGPVESQFNGRHIGIWVTGIRGVGYGIWDAGHSRGGWGLGASSLVERGRERPLSNTTKSTFGATAWRLRE